MFAFLVPILVEGMAYGTLAGFGAHAAGAPFAATLVAGTIAAIGKTMPPQVAQMVAGWFGQKAPQT